jgi:hypothetical protein
VELTPGPDLVGQQVCNAARLDWGVGKVLRVQSMGGGAWRVSIQFHIGHKALLCPPARLVPPQKEGQRSDDWLATAARTTLDARLRQLPEDIRYFLGLPLQKFAALLDFYDLSTDPKSLEAWAKRQTGTSQPLSQWTRDELTVAFTEFCRNRDDAMRETVDRLQKAGQLAEARELLSAAPPAVRAGVREAAPKLV